MDILNLKYPMFKTTEAEKVLLRKIEVQLVHSLGGKWNYFICNMLDVNYTYTAMLLKKKINNTLDNAFTLSSYLHYHHPELAIGDANDYIQNYLRRVWITKLLNYTGK